MSEEENVDLFWGIRGAGHNFSIVSELTVKAYPQINNGVHWTGLLGFRGSKEMVAKVTSAIKEMDIREGMGLQMVWARPPPASEPMILLNLWYGGDEEDAKAAYAPFFALNSVMNICQATPYDHINDGNDHVCAKGGRKPCFSTGLDDVREIEAVWENWVEWSGREGAGHSVVLTECYGYGKAREVEVENTAYAWRSVGVFV